MNQRTLGLQIDLQGRKISDLSLDEFYNDVIQKLWQNGVICIKNQQNLSPIEYSETVSKLGSVIKLPPQLAFNNVDQNNPEIVRVGNIDQEGNIMQKHSAAEYWHTDGNFWPSSKNFIVNWLFSIQVPDQGGETAFMDMQQIYDSISEDEKNYYNQTSFTLDLKNIKDFYGIDAQKLGFDQVVSHKTVIEHPFNSKTALYLGSESSILNKLDGSQERLEYRIKEFASKYQLYVHKWEKGDILLWDNTQVMHRGLGGYGNSGRLLLRCQSRVTPFYIQLMKRILKSL